MSNLIIFGGSVLCGLYCSARLGLFGKTIIKINKDDEQEILVPGIFYNTARWIPGDCYMWVHHNSFKPICFEYTQEYSGWNQYEIDKNGNKN